MEVAGWGFSHATNYRSATPEGPSHSRCLQLWGVPRWRTAHRRRRHAEMAQAKVFAECLAGSGGMVQPSQSGSGAHRQPPACQTAAIHRRAGPGDPLVAALTACRVRELLASACSGTPAPSGGSNRPMFRSSRPTLKRPPGLSHVVRSQRALPRPATLEAFTQMEAELGDRRILSCATTRCRRGLARVVEAHGDTLVPEKGPEGPLCGRHLTPDTPE
jgi:hypothetical protein